MGKRMSSLIRSFINLEGVSERIKELSEDPSEIDSIIDKQMEDVIRELHPDDYSDFETKNREQLNQIKERIKQRYSSEIRDRVSKFLIPAMR